MRVIQNRIEFPNSFSGRNLRDAVAIFHRLVDRQSYQDITLDFSGVGSAYESGMVPLISYVSKLRREKGVDVDIYLPRERRIAAVFVKSQWAHFLCPERYEANLEESKIHTPLHTFRDHEEQSRSVDSILEIIMHSMDVSKENINAIEWSLNEITDNVVNHAGEGIVGYVQALKYSANDVIEFIVSDCGVGIPSSLGVPDHCRALERAIEQGVTRNKETNQGNGLYGCFNIARIVNGQFNLFSYNGNLFLDDGNVRFRSESVPFPGTVVRWSIKLGQPDVIKRALKFGDKIHEIHNSYIERVHDENDVAKINMKETFKTFRSRESGRTSRTYIKNIIQAGRGVILDFDQVNIISSSYADEVIGKLFKELGAMSFFKFVSLDRVNTEVAGLIDRAIAERMKSE